MEAWPRAGLWHVGREARNQSGHGRICGLTQSGHQCMGLGDGCESLHTSRVYKDAWFDRLYTQRRMSDRKLSVDLSPSGVKSANYHEWELA